MKPKNLGIIGSSLRWVLILVAITPLLYATGVYYPFVVPKVVYFRTLVEIATALALIHALYRRDDLNISLLKKKITWVPALFLGASYLSSALGIDFYHSFWSTFERMDGLVTLTHLVAYFYLLLFVFREKEWKTFFVTNAIVGSLVALYAVGQHFGLAWFLDETDVRARGTIGNPAFLASYLAITVFFVFDCARKAKTVFVRYWWWFAIFLHVLAIFWSQTRGIFVAVFGTSLVLSVAWTIVTRERVKRLWGAIVIMGIILSGVLLFAYRQEIVSANIPMLSRVASISATDATTKSRLFVWQQSLGVAQERPFLGYGFENFEYSYNKFYDPQKIGEEWFDRSHNVYIDELVHGGVVGLSLYFLILGFMFYVLWQHRTRDKEQAALWGALLLVYAIQNFFVFDTISSSFLFWALFAFMVFFWFEREDRVEHKILAVRSVSLWEKVAVGVIASGVIVSMYWVNYLPVRANIALSEGYVYQIVDIKRSTDALERGLSYGTFGDLGYGYQVYDMYKNKLEYGKISEKDLKESYDFSESFLDRLVLKYPWDVRLYIYWGHIVEGRPKGVSYDEQKFVERMKRAIELSPRRPQAYYMLANTYLNKLTGSTLPQRKELNTKAIEVLRQYADLVPHYAEAQFIVAEVGIKAGEKALAEEYFKRGEVSYVSDFSSAKRAATYLVRINDYSRAEPYFKLLADSQPGNLDAMVDLAKVYYMNGKIDEAIEVLNEVHARDAKYLEKEPDLVNKVLNAYQR